MSRFMRLIGAAGAFVLSLGPVTAAGAKTVTGLEGIPRFAHVVVLVLENESEEATFGSSATDIPNTYINSLRKDGVFLPDYYGTGHASLDNYVAMVSGQPGNGETNGDCLTTNLYFCAQTTLPLGGQHLGDQFDGAGVSWKSYMDGTSRPCVHEAYDPNAAIPDPYQGDGNAPNSDGAGPDYADRHNPFVTFPDFVGNPTRCAAHQRPYTQLATDMAKNTLPAFSFITPDTCHDGHDNPCSSGQPGGLTSANLWLSQNVPALLSYLSHHDGLLIVNFDEGGTSATSPQDTSCSTCVSGGAGGRTGALFLSPLLADGTTVSTGYDHYSLLRTIEDSFGIAQHLNLAGQATPMAGVFSG